MTDVTAASFDAQVLQADRPVLVDFWAEWCGPCKAIAPVLEQVAAEAGDRLSVVKLNIDEHPSMAARFGVRSIPTLLLFKGGQVLAQKVGAVSRSQIQALVQPHL